MSCGKSVASDGGGFRRHLALDKLLGFESRQLLGLDTRGEGGLFVCRELGDVVEVTLRQRCVSAVRLLAGLLLNFGNDGIAEFQELGDVALRFAGHLGDLLLAQAEFIAEPDQSICRFHRTEIGTLPVMNDLIDQHLLRVSRLNPTRKFFKCQTRRRFKATAAVDDAIATGSRIPANSDRLLDATALNGRLKFGEFRFVKQLARLIRIGRDAVSPDEVRIGETPTAGLVGRNRGLGGFKRQRGKARERLRGRLSSGCFRAFPRER